MNDNFQRPAKAPNGNGTTGGRAFASGYRIGAVLAGVIAIIILIRFTETGKYLQEVLQLIEGLGLLGAGIFAVTYIVATVSLVPASVLTLGAGIVYGLVFGFVLVSVSSTLGAAAAFLVGRYFARNWVRAKIEGNEKFEAVDRAVGRDGWKIVILTRLSPVFPFNLQNYAYGLTDVKFWPYFLASWVGMIPGTLMYVYIGTTLGSLADLGSGARDRGTIEWVFFATGLVVTIGVTIYVTYIARNAIKTRVSDRPVDEIPA